MVALYLGLNLVYALAFSADEIKAIVDGPGNQLPFKPDAVAPIAQLAAQRLFGARWSDPLSVAIGLMLLSSLSAYVLVGPRVIFAMAQAGQFPQGCGPALEALQHPGGGDRPAGWLHPGTALDRVV